MTKLRIVLPLLLIQNLATAGVYFPLHVGDSWGYMDMSYICEGTIIINIIESDTVLNGKTYFVFQGRSVFGPQFARSDSSRVFGYDTTSHSEYLVFDFNAKAGDTIFTNGSNVAIALSQTQFVLYSSPGFGEVYTILDSIGVVSVDPTWEPCHLFLTSAVIDGKKAYPTGVKKTDLIIPNQLRLEQNYPNPFNSSTVIKFFLPSELEVKLDILNDIGQSVTILIEGKESNGWHTVSWDGGSYASGLYFFRLQTKEGTKIRNALLIK